MQLVNLSIISSIIILAINQTVNAQSNFTRPHTNLTLESDETIQRINDYCFDHPTSQNPIQELIDAGLISNKFAGYDCIITQLEKSHRDVQDQQSQTREELRDLFPK